MAATAAGIVVGGGGSGEARAAGDSLLRSALRPFSVMFGEAAPPPLLLSAAAMGFPGAALRFPTPPLFSWFSFLAFISSAASAFEMFSCFFHLVRRF